MPKTQTLPFINLMALKWDVERNTWNKDESLCITFIAFIFISSHFSFSWICKKLFQNWPLFLFPYILFPMGKTFEIWHLRQPISNIYAKMIIRQKLLFSYRTCYRDQLLWTLFMTHKGNTEDLCCVCGYCICVIIPELGSIMASAYIGNLLCRIHRKVFVWVHL